VAGINNNMFQKSLFYGCVWYQIARTNQGPTVAITIAAGTPTRQQVEQN